MGILDRFAKRAEKRHATDEDVEGRSARLLFMLGKANATALSSQTETVAVAILHERKNPTRRDEWEIAGMFVQQYRRWVPPELVVGRETPVTMICRADTAALTPPEANAILADALARVAAGVDVDTCACIGFSGDNDALGKTYLAILAS